MSDGRVDEHKTGTAIVLIAGTALFGLAGALTAIPALVGVVFAPITVNPLIWLVAAAMASFPLVCFGAIVFSWTSFLCSVTVELGRLYLHL